MKTPYTITAAIWHDFRTVQKSGKMNMYGHPYVGYFNNHHAYAKAKTHFEELGNTEDLVIACGVHNK